MNKNSTPLVSVIVPVYNVAQYLPKCLTSLQSQTLKEIEIICVNDASTDESLQILEKFAKADERFVIINLSTNLRQGGARNVGIRKARAKYIGFVDSDDFVTDGMYESLYNKAIETNADIVTSDYYNYFDSGCKEVVKNNDESILALPIEERNRKLILNGIRMWTNIYRKDLIIDNDLYFPEKKLYEDNAVVPVMSLLARKIEKVNIAFYHYRVTNVSSTRSLNNYSFFDRLETSNILLEKLKKFRFIETYPAEVEFKYTCLYYVNSLLGSLGNFTPPRLTKLNNLERSFFHTSRTTERIDIGRVFHFLFVL